jgi:hypothetical protein
MLQSKVPEWRQFALTVTAALCHSESVLSDPKFASTILPLVIAALKGEIHTPPFCFLEPICNAPPFRFCSVYLLSSSVLVRVFSLVFSTDRIKSTKDVNDTAVASHLTWSTFL